MKWISVKDRLPEEYDKYYAIMRYIPCDKCKSNEIKNHYHRLDVKKYTYDIGLWSKKRLDLVEYYQNKDDDSWDFLKNDHFSETKRLIYNEITHWMPLPQPPKDEE